MDSFRTIDAHIEDRGETVLDTGRISMTPGAWMYAIDFLYEKALTKATNDAFEEYLRDSELKSA